MSYLSFKESESSASGKTKTWNVFSTSTSRLGLIHWYNPWKKYVFSPVNNTLFDTDCLREIADFCNTETVRHKVGV